MRADTYQRRCRGFCVYARVVATGASALGHGGSTGAAQCYSATALCCLVGLGAVKVWPVADDLRCTCERRPAHVSVALSVVLSAAHSVGSFFEA